MSKQVIVIRRDLWMPTGMQIQYGIQAALAAVLYEATAEAINDWQLGGSKVEVYVAGAESLFEKLRLRAVREGLPSKVITAKAGAVTPAPSAVAIAIGPGPVEVIDRSVDGLQRYSG